MRLVEYKSTITDNKYRTKCIILKSYLIVIFKILLKRTIMKKLLLLGLILSFNIIAQETEDKYIMLKPLSWDELQLYQLDSLLSVEELELSQYCPTTLRKLQSTYTNINAGFQHILGTNYIWSEYINIDGEKCLVIHEKIDSITPKENKIINPNHYQLLNTKQARILLSASRGIGFDDKGLKEKFKQARMHNQKIKNKPYEKYGGIHNLVNYMRAHKSTYQLDKELVKSLKHKDGNGTKQLPLYKTFEMKYSAEQIQELVDQVKKNKTKKVINKY